MLGVPLQSRTMPQILDCSAVLKAVADTLANRTGSVAELRRRLVTAEASLRLELPGDQVTPAAFAFEAAQVLLRHGLEDRLPEVVPEFPDSRRDLERIALLVGFLRALLAVPGIDQLARAIAGLLGPDLPSRQDLLAALQPGPGFNASLGAALLERIRRSDAEPRVALIRLAHHILAEMACVGIGPAPLDKWYQAKTGGTDVASSPAQRVLSVRLVDNGTRGWTVQWVRGVTPGRKIVRLDANQNIADINALWSILRLAAARLVTDGFVAATHQLVLRIEVESSRALEGFHRATDVRSKVQSWRRFSAVTVWPWLEEEDDIGGFRHEGMLHRPAANAPSETMALHCDAVDCETLHTCVGKRVMLVCTEPVWRRNADGYSAALETHMDRTLSVLIAGDEGEAFLECLFEGEPTRPFHDVFRAVHKWLADGKDLHVVWTDPDYHANPAQLVMLP